MEQLTAKQEYDFMVLLTPEQLFGRLAIMRLGLNPWLDYPEKQVTLANSYYDACKTDWANVKIQFWREFLVVFGNDDVSVHFRNKYFGKEVEFEECFSRVMFI
jgi:hypothetical protein